MWRGTAARPEGPTAGRRSAWRAPSSEARLRDQNQNQNDVCHYTKIKQKCGQYKKTIC